jgi:hypothetical protein
MFCIGAARVKGEAAERTYSIADPRRKYGFGAAPLTPLEHSVRLHVRLADTLKHAHTKTARPGWNRCPRQAFQFKHEACVG